MKKEIQKVICIKDGRPISNRNNVVYTADSPQLSDMIKSMYPVVCKECFRKLVQNGLGVTKPIQIHQEANTVERKESGIRYEKLNDKQFKIFKATKAFKATKWYEHFKIITENFPEIIRFVMANKKEATAFVASLKLNQKRFEFNFKVHRAVTTVVIEPIKDEENNNE